MLQDGGAPPCADLEVALAQCARVDELHSRHVDIDVAVMVQENCRGVDDLDEVTRRALVLDDYLTREPLACRPVPLYALGRVWSFVCLAEASFEQCDAHAARYFARLRRNPDAVGWDAAEAWAGMLMCASFLDDDAARCHDRGAAILAFARESAAHESPLALLRAAMCWRRACDVDSDEARRAARAEALVALFESSPVNRTAAFVCQVAMALAQTTYGGTSSAQSAATAARIRTLLDSDPVFDDRASHAGNYSWSELQWFRALGNATLSDALPTERQERALELDARIGEHFADVEPEALACAARAWRHAAVGAHRAFVERALQRVAAFGEAVADPEWRASITRDLDRLRARLEHVQ
jgi:hypothetical protein